MPRTIGLMSGTSLDGVDAAWLDTDGVTVAAFGPSLTIPYDATMRADLRHILDLAPSLAEDDSRLLDVVARLTDYHARAVEALGVPADLVGFHGQTILHQPDRRRTWQIGDAAELSRRLGLPVAHGFRLDDVAAGGQGAPLAPVYHQALAHGLPKPLAILNIGGVANVTWIGADGTLIACDTGPGNALLDDWALRHTGRPCDYDGALAQAGRPDEAIVAALLDLPFFHRPAPKSLDRLDFARAVASSGIESMSGADGAATLVRFTIEAIVAAPLPSPPLRWIVCGGGRHNPALMDGLQRRLGRPVDAAEIVGWDGDALEAQCFAYLAVRVQAGLPLSYPGTTGVPTAMRGGRIAAP
ncbi:MAG: anhydro-N-acetylmuramic acid kinase [Rhodospirillales bacterium 20-64-7]|nr:MAG: anhydro-N-acetylmuramic acid kinase [Rhodospirillales bacterium 20-64-7]HQT77263.1 anhydro-N-acetylmuramic acid kinase [Rhodopila sp.]